MELTLLKKFLGEPKKVNHDYTKAAFNCPRCKEENNYKFDNKYNLEVNLNNTKKKFKFKQICHCWSCGLSGPIQIIFKKYAPTHILQEFTQYYGKTEYTTGYIPEEIEKFQLPLELPKEFILFSEVDSNNPLYAEPFNYILNVRKLSLEQLKYYKLGFCLEGKYAKRIVIPSYSKENKLNFFITRSYEKKPYLKYLNSDVDKTKIIFNEKFINWNETIYLTEGVFDMFALPINTIPLLGKELNEEFYLFQKILLYKPNIILCLDSDAIKQTKTLLKLLTSYDLSVKYLNMENKDLANNHEINGKEAIIKILKNNII